MRWHVSSAAGVSVTARGPSVESDSGFAEVTTAAGRSQALAWRHTSKLLMLKGETSFSFSSTGDGVGERERDAQEAEDAESDAREPLKELAVVDCDTGVASARVGAFRRHGGSFVAEDSALPLSADGKCPRGTNSAALTLQGRRNWKVSEASVDLVDSVGASSDSSSE